MKEASVKGHTRSRKGKGNSTVRRHKRGYLASKGIKAISTKHGVTFKGDKWPPVHGGMSTEKLIAYKGRLRTEVTKLSGGNYFASPTHRRFINKRLIQVDKLLKSKKSGKE